MTSNQWLIGPIRNPTLKWGDYHRGRRHTCRTCNIELLTGEKSGFCCGPNGSRYHNVPSLPPLPDEIQAITTHPDISRLSRMLNLIFSFASLETTHPFPSISGLPGFLAIQGRVYHRIRPTHVNSAIRWLLFDGFTQNIPYADRAAYLPSTWIPAVQQALLRVNPFVAGLQHLSSLSAITCPDAHLLLIDSGQEIAALIALNNTARTETRLRQLVVSRADGYTQKIPTVSRLWEPLAYPLLFPHGTPGWGLIDRHIDSTDLENCTLLMICVSSVRLNQ